MRCTNAYSEDLRQKIVQALRQGTIDSQAAVVVMTSGLLVRKVIE